MKNLLFILCVILLSCGSNEDDSFLVGHWSLDKDGSDSSPFQSHGQVIGDPELVTGAVGMAYDFNGDDYIEILSDGTAPKHLRELGKGSISLWFKAREWDIPTTILPILNYGRAEICQDGFNGSNEGMIIEVGHGGIWPSENLFFTLYDKPCGIPTMCFDSNKGLGIIQPGKWYHFVAVVGDNHNTGYLNGVELSGRRYNFHTDSASYFFKDLLSHEKLWIGKGFWNGEEVFFNGLIDDVRIYNKPLTTLEVDELYAQRAE